VRLFPTIAVGGPVFVIEMSACGVMFVEAGALLLPEVGSKVGEETDAVSAIVPLVAPVVLNVDVIMLEPPETSGGILHGKAVKQAPVFETKVRPTGVGLLTVGVSAVLGPLFVTTME
jgi:hypothetical protein